MPENYHALYDVSSNGRRRATPPEPAGIRRISEELPSLTIDVDEITGAATRVASADPTARLTAPAASAEDAVGELVQSRGDLWGLSDDDATTVEVKAVSRAGLPVVRLGQRVNGVEVFDSEVTAALTGANEVMAISGQFFPGTQEAARRRSAAPGATVEMAVARAASDLTGDTYAPADFSPSLKAPDGDYRYYEARLSERGSRPLFERPIRVKDVLFPLGEGQFAHGYYMELWTTAGHPFSYVIDSADGDRILFRKELAERACFTYRVHNTGDAIHRPHDGPAPGTPHPTGVPDGFQADPVQEIDVKLDSLLADRPWLPEAATDTRGNNCVAYVDLKPPDGASVGDVFGQASSPGEFLYSYDHAKSASDETNQQNSIVGMFFHVNWLHDRWYEAGFDEAAGNAQQDNFGLGGQGGDPILAEGHDFSGTDNANMATPADGESPRMQMYLFDGVPPGVPPRTSNHEALITFHEMGHYITNRLVGDGNGLTNIQGRAMGEGWGDFFAVCMTSQETDDLEHGVFAVGGWTDLMENFNDNYYFSIRRYPYSADMEKSPLTFRHIGNDQELPAGPPTNPIGGGPNAEVHNAGEVWCAALWEVFVNLVRKHGHAEGERRMLRYVVGGLKLTPSRPTFTLARDGIVTAVGAMDAADLPDVWAGFAKRGMGEGAASPPSASSDLTGVIESFSVPAELKPVAPAPTS
jgi:hypothetical protein